jgi:Rad3-related DNA helicase
MTDITHFFPYPEFRHGQLKGIEDIMKAAENGYSLIEFRAPTGMGKTGCLTTVCKALQSKGMGKAIYTTPQKNLVFQISNDDALGVASLLGRANYPCNKVDSHLASDCPVPAKIRRKTCPKCPYIKAKDAFLASSLGCATLDKILVDKSIPKPDILVIDESQGTEQKLLDQRSIQLPDRIDLEDLEESVSLWVRDTELEAMKYELKLDRLYNKIRPDGASDEMAALMGFVDASEATKTAKTLDKIQRVCEKAKGVLRAIQDDPEGFAIDPKTRQFKPIDGRKMFQEMICGVDLVILASGTPCTQLLADDYAKIVAPHPVDIERRRVYFMPCGKMNYQDREKTMDIMGAKIAELHNKYNRNTLVHCHSFAIADILGNIVRDQGVRVKWVEKKGREESIQAWKDLDDAVLMSVACEEGLDLPGICQDPMHPERDMDKNKYPLNIIAKIPFLPYHVDEWTNRRKEHDMKLPNNKRWENISVAMNIQQAAGRCCRGPMDFSETYILDSSFEYFYRKNYMLFEDWFKDSLCRKV